MFIILSTMQHSKCNLPFKWEDVCEADIMVTQCFRGCMRLIINNAHLSHLLHVNTSNLHNRAFLESVCRHNISQGAKSTHCSALGTQRNLERHKIADLKYSRSAKIRRQFTMFRVEFSIVRAVLEHFYS